MRISPRSRASSLITLRNDRVRPALAACCASRSVATLRRLVIPRPKLHSDAEILEAARTVLVRQGPTAFTLSDVAQAVGISRAALIQRFKDKTTLHRKVMELMTQEVRDYFAATPVEPGLQPLWAFLKTMVAGMDREVGSAAFLQLFLGDLSAPDLQALAQERNALVRQAIEQRLPPGTAEAPLTAGLIQSVIQGAYMRWMVGREGHLTDFMTAEVRRVLVALYPAETFQA